MEGFVRSFVRVTPGPAQSSNLSSYIGRLYVRMCTVRAESLTDTYIVVHESVSLTLPYLTLSLTRILQSSHTFAPILFVAHSELEEESYFLDIEMCKLTAPLAGASHNAS